MKKNSHSERSFHSSCFFFELSSITLLLVIIFFPGKIFSQCSPSIEWSKSFGGTNYDGPSFLSLTSDSGFIATGSTSSDNYNGTGNHGLDDALVIKMDKFGNVVWQKCFGGTSYDWGSEVRPTSDGGYLITGNTYSNDGDVSGIHGGDSAAINNVSDGWVVKLNSTGDIVWQKCLGGSGYDNTYTSVESNDGGFLIAGYTQSNDGDVSGNHGNADMWVIKLSNTGEIVWQKCLGGSGGEYAYSIVSTADGGCVVGGSTGSNDGDVTGNHVNNGYYYDDGWIVKLDADGNLEWQKAAGGSWWEGFNAVITTNDGGFAVTGYESSIDGDATGGDLSGEEWILKFDGSGNIVWQQSLGGNHNEVGFSLVQTADDGYAVAGSSSSNNGDVTDYIGLLYKEDYWVTKLDPDGNLQWSKSLGGSDYDNAIGIVQTYDAGYAVIGRVLSSDVNISDHLGYYDWWMVKLSGDPTNEDSAVYYADADGDGYGDASNSVTTTGCTPPVGYVGNSHDCNDNDSNINPSQYENFGNGVDDDCDGCSDDYSGIFYVDADSDGYGDISATPFVGCYSNISGYSDNNGDCNDADASISPGVYEVCQNGIDDNCNGLVDDSTFFYLDADGDGWGVQDSYVLDCSPPSGYAPYYGDCNDGDASINYYAYDFDFNGIDNNCDGCVDGYKNWMYPDADSDGYGDASSGLVMICYGAFGAPGYAFNNYDCNDNDASIHPGVYEICGNGIDENCNGLIDESETFYADVDGDGFGDAASSTFGCSPEGYVHDSTDCNDSDAGINPWAYDFDSNGIDNNCDGCIDGYLYWLFPDADNDGWGDANSSGSLICYGIYGAPGYVFGNTDCNDADPNINPAVFEDCTNGIDDNCDGLADNSSIFYADADGDGWGDVNSTIESCSPPPGYVSNSGDCNDADATINPNAADWDNNGVDNNCDGCVDGYYYYLYPDNDGDGYGDATSGYVLSCYGPGGAPGYSFNNIDCNDNDASINPGVIEVCGNAVDDNCNGVIDDVITFYADADDDGWGDINSSTEACSPPLGYVSNSGDCNDADPTIHPNGYDVPDNGIDENCDGCVDGYTQYVYPDADGDGYGANVSYVLLCGSDITGYSYSNGDCNDDDPNIYPGANEFSNGIDDNCDGQVDEIQVCSPFIQWEKSLGGSVDDIATSVIESSDGGYVVAGMSYSFNGDIECSPQPGWIAKLNQLGETEWKNCIGKYLNSMVAGPGNDFVLIGQSPMDNFHIVKINNSGNTIWEKEFGGTALDLAISVCLSSDSGYVLAGNTYSNDGDVSGNHGTQDIWVIKVDADGNLLWQKCFGGSDYDWDQSIVATEDGGYFVTGFTYSTDGDVSENHGGTDTWIIKLDADGNMSWEKSIGLYFNEIPFDGIQTSDGGYAIAGSLSYSTLIKLDQNGNTEWETYTDGFPISLTKTDGGIVLAGDIYSIANNSADLWIGQYRNDGVKLWSKSIGGTGTDYAYDIKQVSDSGYVAVGYTNSTDGDVSEFKGGNDYWIVKLSEDPPNGLQTYYADGDGDGYGNSSDSISDISCIAPLGYSYYNTDCDDADSSVHPNAFEDCSNGIDDDCNGIIDDGTEQTFYADADADGYGNPNSTVESCSPPEGYVSNHDDCNDNDASIYPGAEEICNNVDDDCDNLIDNGLPSYTYYLDSDQDTYGNPNAVKYTCEDTPPPGYVTNGSDCNDADASIHPGALEVENGVDDNCDGIIDEGFCINASGIYYSNPNSSSIIAHWVTSPQAEHYKIQCREAVLGSPLLYNNVIPGSSTSFSFTGLTPNTKYVWRIRTICTGSASDWSAPQYFKTLQLKEDELSANPSFALQIYPNPCNGNFNVELTLREEESVMIDVLDVVGKEVFSEQEEKIDGIVVKQFDLSHLSSGTYFIKVIHDGESEMRKIVIEK